MDSNENQQRNGVVSSNWLAEVERSIIHAFEAGYINGHNDSVDGGFNPDTHFVAEDRSKDIVLAVRTFFAAND
jgi:hypothetical protein